MLQCSSTRGHVLKIRVTCIGKNHSEPSMKPQIQVHMRRQEPATIFRNPKTHRTLRILKHLLKLLELVGCVLLLSTIKQHLDLHLLYRRDLLPI